ncbi:uncharacterized protein LOC124126362 [Haliotis rufescens]|uniref:uncharacterized protein LOC124126362 n=1 Tax=Haliotis rufescens TaxID=6454 RepID=UPI001EB07141|nr:uncharacterized protein LOC124126362 [Haliotis rufescens]
MVNSDSLRPFRRRSPMGTATTSLRTPKSKSTKKARVTIESPIPDENDETESRNVEQHVVLTRPQMLLDDRRDSAAGTSRATPTTDRDKPNHHGNKPTSLVRKSSASLTRVVRL